jgi:hypothetical protein
MSDSDSDDTPTQPVLMRDHPTAHYAPELMQLIKAGILDKNLTVCRGWIESGQDTIRRFVRAPTVEVMALAFCRDTSRHIHAVKLPKETVLDFLKMCELKKKWTADRFREFSQEWELMVYWLVRNKFGDV